MSIQATRVCCQLDGMLCEADPESAIAAPLKVNRSITGIKYHCQSGRLQLTLTKHLLILIQSLCLHVANSLFRNLSTSALDHIQMGSSWVALSLAIMRCIIAFILAMIEPSLLKEV